MRYVRWIWGGVCVAALVLGLISLIRWEPDSATAADMQNWVIFWFIVAMPAIWAAGLGLLSFASWIARRTLAFVSPGDVAE